MIGRHPFFLALLLASLLGLTCAFTTTTTSSRPSISAATCSTTSLDAFWGGGNNKKKQSNTSSTQKGKKTDVGKEKKENKKFVMLFGRPEWDWVNNKPKSKPSSKRQNWLVKSDAEKKRAEERKNKK